MYEYRLTPGADRELKRLVLRAPKLDAEELIRAIEALCNEPRPYGIRKMQGMEGLYRIRVGNYRIIYKISDPTQLLLIEHVLRRNEKTYRG